MAKKNPPGGPPDDNFGMPPIEDDDLPEYEPGIVEAEAESVPKQNSIPDMQAAHEVSAGDIPPEVLLHHGPDGVDQYKKAVERRRSILLQSLATVKGIQLNHKTRIMFDITTQPGSNGRVLLNLSCNGIRYAVFGKSGVPKLSELPTHGLESIYQGLQSGDLFDITNGAVALDTPVAQRQPLNTESDDPSEILTEKVQRQLVDLLFVDERAGGHIGHLKEVAPIIKAAQSLDDPRLRFLIQMERESYRPRADLIAALEDMLHERTYGEEEKEILQGLKSR